MRTVNLRRSVYNILRRLSVRSRAERCRPGRQLSLLLNDECQAEALRTLQAHTQDADKVDVEIPKREVVQGDILTRQAVGRALENKEYHKAKFILERINHDDHHDRFVLNICRCLTGDKVSALMDLRTWSRLQSFGDGACALYAWLLNEEGEHGEALRLLGEFDDNMSSKASAGVLPFLHAVLLMRSGFVHDARRIARLHPEDHARMARLGLVESEDHEIDLVMKLADEIISNEAVLRSLVVGLRCDPVTEDVLLLIKAIRRAFNRLGDRATAYEALGILQLIAGEHREARMWILRGMREFPRSSALLMLLLQLPNDYPVSAGTVLPDIGVSTRRRKIGESAVEEGLNPEKDEIADERIPASVSTLDKEAA